MAPKQMYLIMPQSVSKSDLAYLCRDFVPQDPPLPAPHPSPVLDSVLPCTRTVHCRLFCPQ